MLNLREAPVRVTSWQVVGLGDQSRPARKCFPFETGPIARQAQVRPITCSCRWLFRSELEIIDVTTDFAPISVYQAVGVCLFALCL